MPKNIIFIGVDGEQAVNSETTLNQIKEAIQLNCTLINPNTQKPLTWKDLNNEDEPRTLFQAILKDREMRIDNHTLMADRPNFCVITVVENRAVRLEYYEGHDALTLVYDLRSQELQGKDLPKFMNADPQSYDPAAFLEEVFGMPRELTEPILKEIHANPLDIVGDILSKITMKVYTDFLCAPEGEYLQVFANSNLKVGSKSEEGEPAIILIECGQTWREKLGLTDEAAIRDYCQNDPAAIEGLKEFKEQIREDLENYF